MKKGFTLIELLVVIGILAILLAITLIAINPARQFGQANDTRARSDILQVLNSVHQFQADSVNNGQLPAAVVGMVALTPYPIRHTTDGTDLEADLCSELLGTYIPALPVEPSLNAPNITACVDGTGAAVEYSTGYTVTKDANNRITVSGGNDVNGQPITVTR